jgi:hypothetical protein
VDFSIRSVKSSTVSLIMSCSFITKSLKKPIIHVVTLLDDPSLFRLLRLPLVTLGLDLAE